MKDAYCKRCHDLDGLVIHERLNFERLVRRAVRNQSKANLTLMGNAKGEWQRKVKQLEEHQSGCEVLV